MTYSELEKLIKTLTPFEKEMDVTIHDLAEDEFYGIDNWTLLDEDTDILDKGSLILSIKPPY